MRIRYDNILLGILWLLAMTLGASFWFNTAYSFDIFSSSHWQYLSYMQASRMPVRVGFYISMVIIIFATIFGLYLIARPKLRKIRLPIMKTGRTTTQPGVNSDTKIQQSAPDTTRSDASTLDILPAENQPPQTSVRPQSPYASTRPPRLVLPTTNSGALYPAPRQAGPNIQPQTTPTPQPQDWPELREIFASAGYVVKPAPRINGIQIALLAIGANETLWIGGVGIKTTDMRTAIDRLQQIFSDTLDETYIDVTGFVIAAPDAATSEFTDILMFNSMSELREYMRDKSNPVLTDDDGMFDAYSDYIDAVISHIGKI